MTDADIRRRIRNGDILFAGNRKLRIYGVLNCASGKRMKKLNRVFFSTANEAEDQGYRPCGHCMRDEYEAWIRKHSSPGDLSVFHKNRVEHQD